MLPCYHLVRMEVQSSYLASSETTLAGSGRGPTDTSNRYSSLLQITGIHHCAGRGSPGLSFSPLCYHPRVCVCVCVCVSLSLLQLGRGGRLGSLRGFCLKGRDGTFFFFPPHSL